MSNYFDLQVNGYGGIDFNQDDLTLQQLDRACEHLHRDGVAGIYATIISEHAEQMCRRLRTLATLRSQSSIVQQTIAGLHIEGPFINETPGYRGAHPADAIRPADVDLMRQLLDAGDGLVRLVTLAPECDAGFRVTRFLADQGVRISAGHTDASLDQLRGAIDAGLTLFTHLGNGCPMQLHRHDNIIQRALHLAERGKLTPCFIADGVHVPFETLSNCLRFVGPSKCIVVTDAIAPAGLGPGRYKLSRWELLIGEDLVARAPDASHFVGSAITMKQSAEHLKTVLGLSDAEILAMTDRNPRRI